MFRLRQGLELPRPLLGPELQEHGSFDAGHPGRDRVGGHLHDAIEGRATHGHEGVAEVERDRPDPLQAAGHGATLDGQIARNGQ